MMDKIAIFRRSYVKLKLTATKSSLIKVIAELKRKGVAIRHMVIGDGQLVCLIRSKYMGDVAAACKIFNTDFCKVRAYGALGGYNRTKLNAAVILGLIIGIMIVAFMGQYLLKIDIKCDNTLYLGQVEQLVAQHGVKLWGRADDVDCMAVERSLIEGIPDIVMATVYRDGIAIVVDVVTTPQAALPPAKASKLIASSDGIVTRVIVTSGTAMVKTDDRVLVGDILIDGMVNTNKSDYQLPSEANYVPVPAMGEVYAKVYYSKRIYAEDSMVLTKRTNNVTMIREYYIRGGIIGREHTPPYSQYERVVTSSKIDLIIPIDVLTYHYYEVTEEIVPYDAYREHMLTKIKSEMYDELPPTARVISEWVIVDANDKSIIDYHIEVEQRIDIGA